MAQFSLNAERRDPYKNFKFRVRWDGRIVAGVSKVSALRRTTEVVQYRSGADPSITMRAPGQTQFEPLTLERGLTHDTEFERWANKIWTRDHDVSLRDFRKDIVIEVLNEAGQVVLSYLVYRAWPSSYTACSDLDADANEVAIETLILEHEGWQRDDDVKEPQEPGFNDDD